MWCSSSWPQLLEDVLRDAIVRRFAVPGGFEIERPRVDFGSEVAFEDTLDVLSDPQPVTWLHVRAAFEKQNASDEQVGVLHFFDRLLAPGLGEVLEAPVVENSVVQPILIDGRQLMAESLVQVLDDALIALHGSPLFSSLQTLCAAVPGLSPFSRAEGGGPVAEVVGIGLA